MSDMSNDAKRWGLVGANPRPVSMHHPDGGTHVDFIPAPGGGITMQVDGLTADGDRKVIQFPCSVSEALERLRYLRSQGWRC